jgi:hypothetical protein
MLLHHLLHPPGACCVLQPLRLSTHQNWVRSLLPSAATHRSGYRSRALRCRLLSSWRCRSLSLLASCAARLSWCWWSTSECSANRSWR